MGARLAEKSIEVLNIHDIKNSIFKKCDFRSGVNL
jgi:hypothetical protein